MADRHDGARPGTEHGADGGDGRGIEVVGGLVEQEEVRLAGRQHGQPELGPLTTREGPGQLVGRLGGQPERPEEGAPVPLGLEHGVAHVVQSGAVGVDLLVFLGEVAELDVRPELDHAVGGLLGPGQAAQQRGLPGTVAADDHNVVAPPGVEGHLREHLVAAVADAELGDLERDGAGPGRRGERELAGPVPLLDLCPAALHAVDPAVQLLGLAGPLLRAPPHGVGQQREALDLTRLELGGTLALRLVGLLGGLELGVVPLPLGHVLVRDVEDLGDGLVEQLEVVAHDEECAVEASQLIEQPALGGTVQVIRRLVEDHQVGLLEEHAHEVDTAPLAAGQRIDVLQEELLAQAEAVGQAGHDRFGLVAAVRLELLLQVREQLDVLLRGIVGHGAAGGAQRIIEHVEAAGRQDVGEAGRFEPEAAGHRGLREVPERTEEAHVAPVAQLRRGLPHQHGDEGRFPGPVPPHQAHLLAGADHERGVRQQGPVADFDGEG